MNKVQLKYNIYLPLVLIILMLLGIWRCATPTKDRFRQDLQPGQLPHSCNDTFVSSRTDGGHLVNGCLEDSLHAWFVDEKIIAASLVLSSVQSQQGEAPDEGKINHLQYLHNMDRRYASTVITVWCGDKIFGFGHALSVGSVIKYIKPDEFKLFYDKFPSTGSWGYDQWLQYLVLKYPFFHFARVPGCCVNNKPNTEWIKMYLDQVGSGVYISTDVILSEYNTNFPNYVSEDQQLQIFKNKKTQSSVDTCQVLKSVDEPNLSGKSCYKSTHLPIRPVDIWECESNFCETARYIMYGDKRPPKPKMYEKHVIPNIVHYIMFDRKQLGLNFYMSILSFIFIGKVDAVYIHSNVQMQGYYWDKLQKKIVGKNVVHVVYRPKVALVFNQHVMSVQHIADTVKVDIANKYGGIIADIDLFLIRKLDPELYHYDFVISRDANVKHKISQDKVNMGIFMSKPGSLFSQLFVESMRKHIDDLWLWNAGQISHKLIEYNPSLVFLNSRLQSICSDLYCVAGWAAGTEKELTTLADWQKQTYSMHFTSPDAFEKEAFVRTQGGYVGELGRYILNLSGE